MMDEKKQAEARALRDAPRFKNIGGADLELRERNGTVIEVIKPGQVVVGEKYLAFIGHSNMGVLRRLDLPQDQVDDRELGEIVIDTSIRGGK
jgi:hypothetical protein